VANAPKGPGGFAEPPSKSTGSAPYTKQQVAQGKQRPDAFRRGNRQIRGKDLLEVRKKPSPERGNNFLIGYNTPGDKVLQAIRRPSKKVIATGQLHDGIAKRRDGHNRVSRLSCVSNKIKQVPARR